MHVVHGPLSESALTRSGGVIDLEFSTAVMSVLQLHWPECPDTMWHAEADPEQLLEGGHKNLLLMANGWWILQCWWRLPSVWCSRQSLRGLGGIKMGGLIQLRVRARTCSISTDWLAIYREWPIGKYVQIKCLQMNGRDSACHK